MQNDDFYSTPQSNLETDANALEDVKAFSLRGRIGRTYYIIYTMGFTILAYIIMTVFVMITIQVALSQPDSSINNFLPTLSGVLITICMAPVFIMTIIWTIRRSHDFNVTGWLAIILLIPLSPLLFWLIPGSTGANKYGQQPVSGPRWGLILILVPILAGIVAAIAIPAYESYVQRATLGATISLCKELV